MDNFDLQMIPKSSKEDQDVQDRFVQDVAAAAPVVAPEAPVAALADGPAEVVDAAASSQAMEFNYKVLSNVGITWHHRFRTCMKLSSWV